MDSKSKKRGRPAYIPIKQVPTQFEEFFQKIEHNRYEDAVRILATMEDFEDVIVAFENFDPRKYDAVFRHMPSGIAGTIRTYMAESVRLAVDTKIYAFRYEVQRQNYGKAARIFLLLSDDDRKEEIQRCSRGVQRRILSAAFPDAFPSLSMSEPQVHRNVGRS